MKDFWLSVRFAAEAIAVVLVVAVAPLAILAVTAYLLVIGADWRTLALWLAFAAVHALLFRQVVKRQAWWIYRGSSR